MDASRIETSKATHRRSPIVGFFFCSNQPGTTLALRKSNAGYEFVGFVGFEDLKILINFFKRL